MPADYLDPRLRSLLDGLRNRVRRYIVWDAMLAGTAVLLAGFWLGLAIDYLPVTVGGTEMPRSARTVLLVAVLAVLAVLLFRLLVRRLWQPLPDDSLALLLERQHPQLAGRLVTSVQLSAPGRRHDTHSRKLLERVYRETVSRLDAVDPRTVLRRRPLVQKGMLAAPLALLTLGFVFLAPASARLAAGRLLLFDDAPWPRRASLEMVGLEIPRVNADETISETIRTVDFVAGVARLPRGAEATLRIRAATDPFLVPEVCTLYYRGSEGLRGQVNLRRIGRETDGFQSFMLDGPPLNGLNQDLELTIQGLDDRLADLRIELVEPPVITELQVQARYPAYLRPADAGDSADLVTPYQPGLRLREGSDVELVGQASKALEALDLHVVRGDRVVAPSELQLAAEGKQFVLRLDDLREPTTVVVVPVDQEAIAAQTPHRYFLGVVADAPPEMEIRLRGIGSAITPIARLPVAGTVEDDYRLRAAEVTLAQASGSQPQAASIAVAPDRQGEFTSELDLRDLVAAGRMPPLSAGDTVSVYGEATDDYDLGPPHQTRSEIFRLELVAPEDLLALLERRELALRGRLEQTINETRSLGESLERLLRESFSRDPDPVAVTPQPPRTAGDDAEPTERPDPAAELERRAEQVLRLRVQQAGLQARKSGEELTGIANTVADILAEMTHNRIDSVDRRERLEKGVERPLREVVDGPLRELIAQLNELEAVIDTPQRAAARCSLAVEANDAVLLRLTAILEKMLDLESYNEILDMVRDLIENQEALIEDTEKERKQRVLDLFQ